MSRYGRQTTSLVLYFNFHFFLSLFCYLPLPMVFSQLSSNQKTAMINLSNNLNTPTRVVSWDVNKEPNPCLWTGVRCNPPTNSSVIQISLAGYSLSSSDFLPLVCRIQSLQILDVSRNLLTTIPPPFISDCGKLGGLKLLNFSWNNLKARLPDFAGFSGLEALDFAANNLDGSIDSELDGLVRLRSLNLSFNHFIGFVPTRLGKFKVLEELELSMNTFDGPIPAELVGYQNLTLIDLSGNRLSGSVPDGIRELAKLEVLILSANRLSGRIPQSISNITSLWRFAANSNNFNGSIPDGIAKHLKNLDLSYNSLSGSIPSDLLSSLNLHTLDLSNNRLEGQIPEIQSPSLVRLRLGNNSLDGKIPSTASATHQKLTYLELENNNLTGLISPELGDCRNLALLNLAHNHLSGALPADLGNLGSLEVLRLESNNLSGGIPIQITQLPKLSVLNISWNSLNGSIPPSVSHMRSLINMNLQGNKLSGSIPVGIASMNSLMELQLGENQLSGDIPRMPANLQIALNLSSNLFQGPIPETLSMLSGLEIVDLSNNKFSGKIPDFFTGMGALTQLLLSNNELSGEIPDFASWVMVDTSGNKGLTNRTTRSTPTQTEKKNSYAVTIVLAVVAAVVAFGAVTTVALSLLRQNDRVNDERVQTGEELAVPEVLQGNLLTANGIHRSNIVFTRAMEVVSDRSNIVLKTRFSTYYKAIMPSGAIYFVKKLNLSDKIFQLGSHERFAKDLEVFGKLSNSNVMNPLAYVLTIDSAYLFYEFAPKGTLFDALHGISGDDMDWGSRYGIAVGVAQGLSFLHGCTPSPILLLDLSNRSILLKSLKEPLIGEVELLKVTDPSKSTGNLSTIAGSVGYIPPEYAYTMRVTMAGNIYSFGVILLELLTGKQAVSEGIELAKWVLSNSAQQDNRDHILDYSISRTSIAVRSQMLAVLKIALACVSVSPEARPRMKSVLRMLLNAR
ncbi:leucine-rich repeat receptor-like tyrosine-protein kinase PXC3 [Pyrus x bretschneideri]|uniref:leucine-rich repeat receptor-like tyrosine-protein kinase PXC3 n=1 Tax=Pyrus x bretschneideri TaxID=225117 RepID=UPI00202F71C1|nr:leucine-rich repeat receptor-like tyrosine-protein kinase PXC3 [Pyrus x bretschneideri]